MSSLELKEIINERLSHIDDVAFLKALKTIIESKVSESEYQLSEYQRQRIDLAEQQFKTGHTITDETLQNEINQWLGLMR